MRREDRCSIASFLSRRPRWELGLKRASSTFLVRLAPAQGSSSALAPAQAGAHPQPPILTFVRPRRRLTSAPTAEPRGRRAQMLSRLARFRATRRAWPCTASSTTARSSCRGLLTRAGTRVPIFSSPRSRGRGGGRSRRCARACWRARSPARCGAAAGRPPRSRA